LSSAPTFDLTSIQDLDKEMRMVKGLRRAAAVILLCLPTAARAVEFSADAVFHGSRGATGTNKVNVSNGQIRVQPVGDPAYEIFDNAKHIDDIIIPAKKLILAQGPHSANLRGARYSVGPNLCNKISTPAAPAICTKQGPDKLNGRLVEKWQFSRTMHGRKLDNTFWVDPGLNAIVKVERDGRVSYELLNIRPGAQPASLFTVPAGFQTKQMPDLK
jgi:hypothetical protein